MDFYLAPTHVNKYHSFEIHQLPLSSKKFMYETDWEKASKKFEPFDYCCTYKGRFLDEPYIRKLIKKKSNMMTDLDLLEALFYMTACEPPKTFGGHPIKSSFVVVLHRGDDEKETHETSRAYYCNPIGWTDISNIWWQRAFNIVTI